MSHGQTDSPVKDHDANGVREQEWQEARDIQEGHRRRRYVSIQRDTSRSGGQAFIQWAAINTMIAASTAADPPPDRHAASLPTQEKTPL
jgi:hypothetical protein